MTRRPVLIVDDHPAMRHSLALLLGREPDLVVLAAVGDRESAIAAIEGQRPALAIVDIQLQEGRPSGLELIGQLRSRIDSLPVLVYSMHEHVTYARMAFEAGAQGYLSKRAPVEEILVAVRELLRGRGYSTVQSGEGDLSALSAREFEVFRLIGEGMQPRAIARTLCISTKTVESHRLQLRRKLGLRTAGELSRFAVGWRHGAR